MTVFISVGETQEDEVFGFMDIIEILLTEDSPLQVLTMSYASDAPDLSLDLSQCIVGYSSGDETDSCVGNRSAYAPMSVALRGRPNAQAGPHHPRRHARAAYAAGQSHRRDCAALHRN